MAFAAFAQSNDDIKTAAEVCKQNRARHVAGKDVWPAGYENCATVMARYFEIFEAEKTQQDKTARDLINKIK